MRPRSHTPLASDCLCIFCFLGDIAFFRVFCIIAVSSSYGEYVVRFFLPDGVFLPCDHELDFNTGLCENAINKSNKTHEGEESMNKKRLRV